ncbi:bifunctional DNA primase/polymerase [Brachybacterium fresconis]|uniref:Primase-polymerase (Primpol)-like protein n=1 Tax=Brachybacterium fresconis TaxID=173363 RepID=A0ABS4YIC9_9MICO|nr:hypothetical protein [Brachybacterium fresconis]MBP2408275.1 primase-polymerase (primpol)-like protein [Brachybacterium fresconis]
MPRTCEQCGGRLAVTARRDARFCQAKCRVYAQRQRTAIPAELRFADRWTRRVGKRPFTPMGSSAASTRPGTWSTYRDVRASKLGDGIGFMLGAGFACLDLDHCVSPDGSISELAQHALAVNPDAWVELSLSGTGLHVWGLMPEGPGRKQHGLEVYSKSRFIALGSTYRQGGLYPLRVPELVA